MLRLCCVYASLPTTTVVHAMLCLSSPLHKSWESSGVCWFNNLHRQQLSDFNLTFEQNLNLKNLQRVISELHMSLAAILWFVFSFFYGCQSYRSTVWYCPTSGLHGANHRILLYLKSGYSKLTECYTKLSIYNLLHFQSSVEHVCQSAGGKIS